MSFNGYSSYKESGLPWIGLIPDHWKKSSVKRLFHLGRGRVISTEEVQETGSYPVYSSQTLNNGCLGYIESYDFDCDQITWTTDGANAGAIFLREGKHNCTNVCGTLLPKTTDYNLKFGMYYLSHITQFYKRPDTNGAKIMNGEMADIPLLIPELNEQLLITKFLDQETAEIDSLVFEQERLIDLLKEKRQAVVSHAVTKGLDPKVKMKDSGVTWIGDIPEHWELKKIKWCAKLKNEKTSDRSNTIALENIEGWTGRFVETESEFEGDGVKFNEGDILFGKLRPYLAKVFRATSSGEAIGDFFVLEPNQNLLSQFAERLFISTEFIDAINSSTYGTKMPRVNWEHFSSMLIPLPPKHEQIRISNYLVTAIEEMDELIETSNDAINLLEERRTAIISAAATGQIDVRNYQPKEVT